MGEEKVTHENSDHFLRCPLRAVLQVSPVAHDSARAGIVEFRALRF